VQSRRQLISSFHFTLCALKKHHSNTTETRALRKDGIGVKPAHYSDLPTSLLCQVWGFMRAISASQSVITRRPYPYHLPDLTDDQQDQVYGVLAFASGHQTLVLMGCALGPLRRNPSWTSLRKHAFQGGACEGRSRSSKQHGIDALPARS